MTVANDWGHALDQTRKVLRVFLASPGDLGRERQYAKACIEEWNLVHSDRIGWSVDLIGWEDTLPQTGRPQAIINADIRRCSIFVGMMWRRWGSPSGNQYTSGFQEEFELASELNEAHQVPQIVMFFKEMGSVEDAGPSLQQVIDFKKKIISERKILFKELPSEEILWRDQFRQNLHRTILSFIDAKEGAATPSETQSASPESEGLERDVADGADSWNWINILRKAVSDLADYSEPEQVPAASLARIRLISSGWRRAGLARTYLPIHDSNAMFLKRDSIELSRAEMFSLIDAGLAAYAQKAVPFWTWLRKAKGQNYLNFLALYPYEQEIALSAFEVLGSIEFRIEAEDKKKFKEHFKNFAVAAKIAALGYIGKAGDADLLDIAEEEYARADAATTSRAAAAVIDLRSVRSKASALEFVIDNNVEVPSAERLQHLTDALPNSDQNILARALKHRDAKLRAESLTALARAGKLSEESLSQSRSDSSPKVRAAGVWASIGAGVTLNLDEIKAIVVKDPSKPINVLSDDGWSEYWEIEKKLLDVATTNELQEAAWEFYSPADYAYEQLGMKDWNSSERRITRDLESDFSTYFDEVNDANVRRLGTEFSERLNAGFSRVRDFRVKEMVRAALNVLGARGGARHVRYFRDSYKRGLASPTERDLTFFAKHGEWADIVLLDESLSRLGGGRNSPRALIAAAGQVAVKLGKGRLEDLLMLDLAPIMLAAIIIAFPKKRFGVLNEHALGYLLKKEDDRLREIASIKFISTSGKAKILDVLNKYIIQEQYFYNVAYWLDFGLSANPLWVAAAVKAELEKGY